jgi:hypothetical protein
MVSTLTKAHGRFAMKSFKIEHSCYTAYAEKGQALGAYKPSFESSFSHFIVI